MEKKENSDLIGKLCYFGKEIVLVIEKKKTLLKFSKSLEKYQYESYNVLFPAGCIDCVGENRLNIVD